MPIAMLIVFALVASACSSSSTSSPPSAAAAVTAATDESAPSTNDAVGTAPGTDAAASASTADGGTTASTDAVAAETSTTAAPVAIVADRTLLPPPAPAPTIATPDDVQPAAAALAAAVVRGGAAGQAALETALTMSGIGIVDLDGSQVAAPAEPQQGIFAEAGEVLALPDLAAEGGGAHLDDVLATFAMYAGVTIDPVIARYAFTHDLFTMSRRDAPIPRQFFASFLVELGQADVYPTDLLGPIDANTALDSVQQYLILLRVVGDMAVAQAGVPLPAAGSIAPEANDSDNTLPPDTTPDTVDPAQGFVEPGVTITRPSSAMAPRGDSGPCDLDTTGSQVADTVAGASGWAWSAIWNVVEKQAGAAGFLSPILAKSQNILLGLTLLKFVISSIAFQPMLGLDGDGRALERTKTTTPGEERNLVATLKYDLGAGQYLNCLRVLFVAVGADFSVANQGAVSGAELQFSFFNNRENALLFRSLPGNKDAISTITNADGVGMTGLIGEKQRRTLPDTATSYIRSIRVIVHVNLKPANIRQDFTDAIGVLLSGVATPVVGGLVALLTSLLDRMGYWNYIRSIQVKDWYKDLKIDARADLFNPGGNDFPKLSTIKCDGPAGDWEVQSTSGGTTGTLAFTLDNSGVGSLAAGDFGQATVTLVQGPVAWRLHVANQYFEQSVRVVPGDFCDP